MEWVISWITEKKANLRWGVQLFNQVDHVSPAVFNMRVGEYVIGE